MNALAGWGFATQEAFERHCNPTKVIAIMAKRGWIT